MSRLFGGTTAVFDDLCRYLSQPMPRRTALKTLIATGATVLLTSRDAWGGTKIANVPPSPFFGTGRCASPPVGVCGSGCCAPPIFTSCCRGVGGIFSCCAPGPTNSGCCGTGCCFDPVGAVGTDCCPTKTAPHLCCPSDFPQCCESGLGLPGAGSCCPSKCCCKLTSSGGVLCTCPTGVDPVGHLSGGGAFLSATSQKTVCHCDICTDCLGTSTTCSKSSGVGRVVFTCFNYSTSSLIQASTMDSFDGTLGSGSDFSASGSGPAVVNGVPTTISFTASKTLGVVNIEVTDESTGMVLGGGTGESGLANLGLSIFN